MTESQRMRRLFGSRGFMSALSVLALSLAGLAGYVMVFHPEKRTETYCALMPDSIGLYPGSHVTMRGITVGQVTAVHPQDTKARVEFRVDAAHPVLTDVSATTVSDTVVADRELAVLSSGHTDQRWDRNQCITRTLTPKSISETLDAVAKLSSELLGPDKNQRDSLGRAVTAMNAATEGTGPQLNAIIQKLGTTLSSSDAAIGHLAGSLDALSSLSDAISTHWGDIKSMLQRMGPVLDQVDNELFTETVYIINGFQRVLPLFNDITTLFGDPIFAVLDAAVPLVRFIGAHVGSLQETIAMTPALVSAFTTVLDPRTGRTGLTYAPPQVAIASQDAEQICAAVNAIAAQSCTGTSDGMVHTRLVQLVLAAVGAR